MISSEKYEKFWRWCFVFFWMGLIFYLSSVPNLRISENQWDLVLRKIAHFMEFFILAFAWFRALIVSVKNVSFTTILAWSCFASLVYAFLDEYHQFFVPTRHFSLIDVAIDGCGTFAYGGIVWKKKSGLR